MQGTPSLASQSFAASTPSCRQMSVGKEKFAPDAKQLMEMLHATLSSKLESDDPQVGSAALLTALLRALFELPPRHL